MPDPNNAEFIRSRPPSLGTMEAESERLYASRMKSVPCGWSARGYDYPHKASVAGMRADIGYRAHLTGGRKVREA